jgi:dienelactone hydrolase
MRRLAIGLALAVLAAGCGGGDDAAAPTASRPSPFAYDDSAPLRLVERSSARREGLLERELTFAVAGGPPVAATLVKRPGAQRKAGVVYLHGAGGSRRDMLPLARRVARRGAVALALDQPEPGAAESRLSGIAALEAQERVTARAVVAVRRAVDLLLSEGVDTERLGVVGWSGGARVAALAAGAEPRFDAAVLMSAGALPVSRYVAAAPPELRADVRRVLGTVDPLRWLRRTRAELLLQNGRDDEIVPREALVTLANAAPRGRVLRWYDAGHALNERAYDDQLAWLAARLDP